MSDGDRSSSRALEHVVDRTSLPILGWEGVEPHVPIGVTVEGVDLVVIRQGDSASVLYGRCAHRGALLADGTIRDGNIICGVHGWDYRIESGVSAYDNDQSIHRFTSWVHDDQICIDGDELQRFRLEHPQAFESYGTVGKFADVHPTPEEPYVAAIHELAKNGLTKTGHHGPAAAMGVPRTELPTWDDLQIVTAQLARFPLLDEEPVGTDVVIGPNAAKPLHLDIPIFVTDMSFGALSAEAKTALARGAQRAGTGICSGEGGMLPEEQRENDRYFYELASARFGWSMDILDRVQAFHFKGGQGAKTGTGGHLPGDKVFGRIAEVRGLPVGTPAISPARFPDWTSLDEYRAFAQVVRERSGGIPIGYKLSAQRIEEDIDAALAIGVDYIILDGRGGGTGAAPLIFRDNISVPTIPALARARRHLDRSGHDGVTLIITGGLRTAADIAKALALGADAVAIANAALQAIGCVGMRACQTNNCPVGIATQQPKLRERLIVEDAAQRLDRFLRATVELIQVLARACGHHHVRDFELADLTTFHRDMAELSGVSYGGWARND